MPQPWAPNLGGFSSRLADPGNKVRMRHPRLHLSEFISLKFGWHGDCWSSFVDLLLPVSQVPTSSATAGGGAARCGANPRIVTTGAEKREAEDAPSAEAEVEVTEKAKASGLSDGTELHRAVALHSFAGGESERKGAARRISIIGLKFGSCPTSSHYRNACEHG